MGRILVKSAINALKIEVFKKIKKFVEEIQFSGTFLDIDIFWKLQSLKHFLLNFCQLILEIC